VPQRLPFLRKSFRMHELLEKVREVIDGPPAFAVDAFASASSATPRIAALTAALPPCGAGAPRRYARCARRLASPRTASCSCSATRTSCAELLTSINRSAKNWRMSLGRRYRDAATGLPPVGRWYEDAEVGTTVSCPPGQSRRIIAMSHGISEGFGACSPWSNPSQQPHQLPRTQERPPCAPAVP